MYFDDECASGFSVSSTIVFEQEPGYGQSGYIGAIPLSDMLLKANENLPQTVNIKRFEHITLCTDSNDVQFVNIPETIENTVENAAGIVIDKDKIDFIAGAAWSLGDDLLNPGKISSGRQSIDFNQFNKYGILKEQRISGFYNFSDTDNTGELNMFHTLNGLHTDNKNIVIHPEVGDYTNPGITNGYSVDLVGIDNNPFRGLRVREIVCFGKGKKSSDGYILEKSADAPIRLLPVSGNAQGDISLSCKGSDNVWQDIPIYNNTALSNIITFWNVTGLSGLYTLRLVSSLDNGSRINIAFREIYLGYKVDTKTEDITLSSTDGQAALILPCGALEETNIISVETVDYDKIKDIALLPDIAPAGEVVRLSPDGMEFTDKNAYPQLQFTYNKDELVKLGVHPASLTIYNLDDNGALHPIDTIKQLVKVEYDTNGAIKSENVIWDSASAVSQDLTSIDYTYVRAWAVITHFSYYLMLEGDIRNMPKIDQKNMATSEMAVAISGSGNENTEILVYITRTPGLLLDNSDIQPIASAITDDFGTFSIQNIPLLFEGINFIFTGHAGSNAVEYNKLIVTRDTVPPDVYVSDYDTTISPNNDGVLDSATLKITCSEHSSITVKIIDTSTACTAVEFNSSVSGYDTILMALNGYDSSNTLLPDNEYSIVITARDKVNNESTINDLTLTIDTKAPLISIISMNPVPVVLSPLNNDGNYDNLAAALASDEQAVLNIRICNEIETVLIDIAGNICVDKTAGFTWNGQNDSLKYVKDGVYFIEIQAKDRFGNNNTTRYISHPVTIDNTPPHITLLNPENEIICIPARYSIQYTANEESPAAVQVVDVYGNILKIIQQQGIAGTNTILWDIPEDFTDGIYTISIKAEDSVKNSAALVSCQVEITHDNKPPDLIIPPDIIVEANDINTETDTGQAEAIDQSPPVEITNNAPLTYPLGVTIVTWKAKDRYGNSITKDQKITIVDTTPPVLNIPEDIVKEAEGIYTPVNPGTAGASDIFDVIIEVDSLPAYGLGTTPVIWRAIDSNGNVTVKVQLVTIVDTTGPVMTLTVTPDTLWPPNNKLVRIEAIITVNDVVDPDPGIVLTSIQSNESDDNDIQDADIGTEDYEFLVRAEKQKKDGDRIYTITYTVTDFSGNSTAGSATVIVPHDRGEKEENKIRHEEHISTNFQFVGISNYCGFVPELCSGFLHSTSSYLLPIVYKPDKPETEEHNYEENKH